MAKVLNILESKIVHRSGKMYQRVIFSDDRIVYVENDTGDVTPDTTPDKYVDLISAYNSTHAHPTQNQKQSRPIEPNGLRKAAAVIDMIIVFIVGWIGIVVLFNGGWLIITLAWMIPMTIMTTHSVTDGKQRVALGVCHLIFFNIISGILILVSNGQIQQEAEESYANNY